MVAPLNLIGEIFGRLVVLERAESDRHGRTRWLCRCECGTERVFNRLDLRNGDTRSCGCLFLETAVAVNIDPDDQILYYGAHDRCRRAKGKAAAYKCVCGCGRQAEDWALKRAAPGARQQHQPGRNQGLWLSPNPDDYQPMAKTCHKHYDIAARRARSA